MRSKTVRLWVWLGLVLLATPRSAVRAQEDDASRTLLREALVEFNAGRWDEAYVLFQRMHQAEPSARALRGMGLSAFEGGRYAAAVIDLKAALTETRRPLSDEQRAEVKDVLARADGFVARFQLQLRPSSARITVDGREPLFAGPSVLLLDPGMHEIVAVAGGHESVSRSVRAQSGDRRELSIELPPKAQAGGNSAAQDESNVEYAGEAEGDGSEGARAGGGPPILAYVAAGGAVLFAGAGIGLHFAAKGAAQDVEDACLGRCTPAQADQQISDSGVETYQALSFVGYGLAAASAIAATVLFVIGSDAEGAKEPGVALGVAPDGLSVSGRF